MKEKNYDLTKISKYISLILRHKPDVIGIQLDTNGWANVEELLAGIGRKYPIDFEILEEIVRTELLRTLPKILCPMTFMK